MPLRSPVLLTPLFAAATLMPACVSEDPTIAEGTLRTNLAAWTSQVRKECSVAAAFGQPGWADDGAPPPALDASLLLRGLGGTLMVTDGSDLAVFGTPQLNERQARSLHHVDLPGGGGLDLAAMIDDRGVCTVWLGRELAYQGQLWAQLPLVASMRPSLPAPRESAVTVYGAATGTGPMFVEAGYLDVVADALAPDVDSAAAVLARRLGLAAVDLREHVVAAPPWLAHVEASDAAAPFSILGGPPGPRPVASYAAPLVPITGEQRSTWTWVGHHRVSVVLPRPQVTHADYTDTTPMSSVAIELDVDTAAIGRVLASVTGIYRPEGTHRDGATCFRQVADVALAYLAEPALASGAALVPSVVAPDGSAPVSAPWLTVPCSAVSSDLASDLRDDPAALVAIGKLLDPSRYPRPASSTAIAPRGWDLLLTALAPQAADLTTLSSAVSAVTPHPVLEPAIASVRAVIATPAYAGMLPEERALRRQAAWRLPLSCGRALSSAEVERVVTDTLNQLRTTVLEQDGCPLR